MGEYVLIADRIKPVTAFLVEQYLALGVTPVVTAIEGDEAGYDPKLGLEVRRIGSYSSIDDIVSLAAQLEREKGANVLVDPGVGPLAENYRLAAALEKNGLRFIGPSPDGMVVASDKVTLREIAEAVGVPTLPWKQIHSIEHARKVAEEIGYPVVAKLARAGGGRGTEVALNEAQLEAAFYSLGSRASNGSVPNGLFLEKALTSFRHIEEQLIGDTRFNVFDFGNRDCSIQRKFQKLREFAPAGVSPELEGRLRQHALALYHGICREARELAVNDNRILVSPYKGPLTLEFGVGDDEREFLFETNVRWQVEGVVSMLATGVNMVQYRWHAAKGRSMAELLPGSTNGKVPNNWGNNISYQPIKAVVEYRINAEQCLADEKGNETFLPSPGRVTRAYFPEVRGVQVYSGVRSGTYVSELFDSNIVNVVATGDTIADAISRARTFLGSAVIEGIHTNIPHHLKLIGKAELGEQQA